MKSSVLAIALVMCSVFGAVESSGLPSEHPAYDTLTEKCAIRSFDTEFRDASVVFVGKVLSEKKNNDTRTFVFEVEKYWKGRSGKRLNIDVYETTRYQAWFKVGESFLVYAYKDKDGKLNVGRCSRSTSLDLAREDLKKLGKSTRPK